VKYTVTVEGRPVEVEVLGNGGVVRVRSGGSEREAELLRVRGDGAWTLRLGGRTRVVVVEEGEEGSTVTVGGRAFRVSVEDEREAAAHAVRAPEAAGPRVIRSVMPGIVREVLVAAGAAVEAKAPLLVLEAMKMQNEVRADRAGRVVRLHVAPGATVARGEPLVTLE
jgi:biotin carboxyl carrier protein